MSTKKFLIVYILKILETDTDKEHPLTQTKIAKIISAQFPCDRKTVGRNIKFLIEAKYPIIKTNKGFYMDKKPFTIDEQDLIIDSILQSNIISDEKKTDIAIRLTHLLAHIRR